MAIELGEFRALGSMEREREKILEISEYLSRNDKGHMLYFLNADTRSADI